MPFLSTSRSTFGGRLRGVAAATTLAAVLAVVPSSASAHGSGGLPDAEIFATNETALITDPADPRLDKRLTGFARTVKRIIRYGGAAPRGSQLLDGVFFSSKLNLL